MKTTETKTFTVTAGKETMLKIERLLSWMHWNTRWGHSGTVAMDVDGDGDEKVDVSGVDTGAHRDYVSKMAERKRYVESIFAD